MTVRMRHTKSHTANRRSHHALKGPRLSTCANCNERHVRHQVCLHCGQYRGRQVIDVVARDARKEARRKAKLQAMGLEVEGSDSEEKTVQNDPAKAPGKQKRDLEAIAGQEQTKSADKQTKKSFLSRKRG